MATWRGFFFAGVQGRAIVVFVTSAEVIKPAIEAIVSGPNATAVAISQETVLTKSESGLYRTIAFLMGCLASGAIGFLGMSLAVRANVRTAAAARQHEFGKSLRVAFRSGAVVGLFTAGLGLLGASLIILIFQNSASIILVMPQVYNP